ncbi:MAG: RNA polymerase sigma factor [Kiritimatiellia bacterium]
MFGFSKKRNQFEAVVEHYHQMMLATAARLLGRTDHAEDVVQDTFIRLARQWKAEMVPSPAMTVWLRTALRNIAFDYLRKQRREANLHQRAFQFVPESMGPYRNAGQVAEAKTFSLAEQALSVLSERERELVILRIYEELSYKEISETTGLSVSNVGFILHEAMRKMAKALSSGTRKEQGPHD